MIDISKLNVSVEKVLDHFGDLHPMCVSILGSGWSSAVESLDIVSSLDYEEIPALGAPGVQGHAGQLILARLADSQILIFKGRRHWYEGCGWTPIAFPVYLASRLKANTLLLTCAAGSLNPAFQPGQLVIIRDHLNHMGANPLQGPHIPAFGPRFPDQTEVYNAELRTLMHDTATRLGEDIPEGVYAASPGPFYETPAEIAALKTLGADLVGMSTVPEAAMAHATELSVLGVACVSNMAAGMGESTLSHNEVIDIMKKNQHRMASLLTAFFERLTESSR